VIELQHISKVYEVGGQPIYALRDNSEIIQSGEYVAIVGPSGSGKSILSDVYSDQVEEPIYLRAKMSVS